MFASDIKKGQTSEDRSRGAEGVAVQYVQADMLQGHGDALEWIQDNQEQNSSGQHASGVGWRITCLFAGTAAQRG